MTDAALETALSQISNTLASPDGTLALEPETAGQDIARLVLGLAEFLRQLMELQAIRRIEAGGLTSEEEERVGAALREAERAIRDVAQSFDVDPEALSLDLGPLGRTI